MADTDYGPTLIDGILGTPKKEPTHPRAPKLGGRVQCTCPSCGGHYEVYVSAWTGRNDRGPWVSLKGQAAQESRDHGNAQHQPYKAGGTSAWQNVKSTPAPPLIQTAAERQERFVNPANGQVVVLPLSQGSMLGWKLVSEIDPNNMANASNNVAPDDIPF